MASAPTIRPEQITRAKKLLQDLPEKENKKTRPEAAKLLEKDFRKALKKGYSAKEISAVLKNEGIIIPAYLVKNFFSESDDTPHQTKEKCSEEKKTSFVSPNTSDTEL